MLPVAPVERAPKEPAAVEPSAGNPSPAPRVRSGGSGADLSDQIALVDAARAAVASGGRERALVLLRQYRDKYPTGSFRPEVATLEARAAALPRP
jgi:hypothetical protein